MSCVFEKMKKDNKIYISKVREIYCRMDLGHDEKHFDEVYNEACKLGYYDYINGIISEKELRYVITAAAYHDIGRIINNKDHEKYSVDIIKNYDKYKESLVGFNEAIQYLYDNFTEEEIDIICEVISQHRSKAEATTEMARIVKDADKISRTDYDRFLYRIIGYTFNEIKDEDNDIMMNRSKAVLRNYINTHESDPKRVIKSLSIAYNGVGNKEPSKFSKMPDDKTLYNTIITVYNDYLDKKEKGIY